MNVLRQVLELYAQGQYDSALEVLMQADSTTSQCPSMLVTKGRLIQLSDHGDLQLSDAEMAFKQAAELDAEYASAVMELGWLYANVYDDVTSALPHFEKALSILRSQTREAVEGMAKCLTETAGDKDQLLRSLKDVKQRIFDDDDMEQILRKL